MRPVNRLLICVDRQEIKFLYVELYPPPICRDSSDGHGGILIHIMRIMLTMVGTCAYDEVNSMCDTMKSK